MHYCPDCGQACYCHGDIDDCVVETEEYSAMHCTCDHDGSGLNEDLDDDIYDPEKDEEDATDEC